MSPRRTFANRPAQTGMAVLAGIVAVIGLVGVIGSLGPGWAGVVLFLAGAGCLIRALRSSCVVVTDEAVEARSVLRTRRYDLTGIRAAEVVVGQRGLKRGRWEYLVLRRTSDDDAAFRWLNAKVGLGTVVRAAAKYINQRVDGLR